MNISDFFVAWLRTVIPAMVGAIVAALAAWGIDVDATSLEVVFVGLATGVYYAAVRYLAKRFPALEWLIGWRATPTYR